MASTMDSIKHNSIQKEKNQSRRTPVNSFHEVNIIQILRSDTDIMIKADYRAISFLNLEERL